MINRSIKPDLTRFLQELDYSVDLKSKHLRPGRWKAAGRLGDGFSFEKFVLLSNYPDFRKIDVLATTRSPLANEPLVRVSRTTSSIDVLLMADLSLSLDCGFSESKLFQIAKLSTLLGFTAFKYGDRFGFLGFDDRILDDFYYPPKHSRTGGLEIGERILNFNPSKPSRSLSLNTENYLPEKKSLIFLVSDFYFEPNTISSVMDRLSRHRVQPVILRHERERRWPRGLLGILQLKDSESEKNRILFFSSRTIRKFEKKAAENEKEIERIFHSRSVVPIFLEEVDADRILDDFERSGA